MAKQKENPIRILHEGTRQSVTTMIKGMCYENKMEGL